MQINLLETYRAVLEAGTTLAAARQLGISQSGVSRRLAQLEEELGLSLFVRDKTRLVPTREGRQLEGQVSAILDQSSRLLRRADELRTGTAMSSMLRVGFPASLTLSIVPSIVGKFLEGHPNVQLEIHTGAYDTIERMLLDERVEVGFLRAPLQRHGLVSTPLSEAQTVCVMPRKHLLAERSRVSVSDLVSVDLILLGRLRQPRREIDELFWQFGIRPRVRIEAHSVMSACALAAAGFGVTLVNGLMAQDYAHLPIVVRPLAEPLTHRFAFAHREEGVPSVVAQRFIEVAAEHFEGLLNHGPDGE